jgi:hypothetical protein
MTMTPADDPTSDHTSPAPSGLLHLRTWLPAELDETFSVWCDGHHGEQLEVPGFRRVRRFSLVASTAAEPADYLTVYDLDRLDVLESDAYAAYRARGNTVPEALQGRLRAARTDAWLVAAAPAVEPLDAAGSGLAHLFVADGPDLGPWFAQTAIALVDALGGAGATAARLFRGAAGEQVVVVELGDPPDPATVDATALPVPATLPMGAAWGLYRLDHVDLPGGPASSPHLDRHGHS